MTPGATILQAARTWLKAHAHPDGTALTDKQVVASDAPGPRPPLPYLAVKVTTLGLATAQDEPVGALSTVTPRGRRSAVVSVHGFGAETEEWLEEAALALALEAVGDTLEAAGLPRLGFVDRGAIANDTLPLDSSMQPRFLREFDVAYAVTGRTVAVAPVESVEVTHTTTAVGQPDRDTTILVTLA